jgi:hypothetical protein
MASILLDKSIKPNKQLFSDTLGRSYKYWEEIRKALEDQYGNLTEEWKYYGANLGWTLKLLKKKRNLFFLAPCKKYFRIAFIFGDKAVTEVEKSDLPTAMIEELVKSKRFVEGRVLPIDVKKRATIKHIIKLVAIKVHN